MALPAGDVLRVHRAIQLLEIIGTPEARRQLQCLAEGSPLLPQTQHAKAALQRLTPRKYLRQDLVERHFGTDLEVLTVKGTKVTDVGIA